MTSALDIVTNALYEVNAYAQGENPSAADAAWVLNKLNRLIDLWNSQSLFIFNVNFQVFNLLANHQPHTIGPMPAAPPNPDFVVLGARPVKIVAANILLANVNPAVRVPLNIRDDDWWANVRVRTLATSLPTDLYYSPAFPFGQVNLWPVSNVAAQIELEMWSALAGNLALGDDFSMPQGYEDAVTLTLAESICPSFQRGLDPGLVEMAKRARAAIRSLNSVPDTMDTTDLGVPDGGRGQTTYNYRTGGR